MPVLCPRSNREVRKECDDIVLVCDLDKPLYPIASTPDRTQLVGRCIDPGHDEVCTAYRKVMRLPPELGRCGEGSTVAEW